MHTATSTLIEEYKQENARLENENDQLRNVARKVIEDWGLSIMDILKRNQPAEKVKTLEEKLKKSREFKEKLLEQLIVVLTVNTDISYDGEWC